MLFSILIANYNNANYLTNAVNSVLTQDFNNWEIIIVDDGSTDEFEQVIPAYAQDSRIKIFRNGENKGCTFTKNECIKRSSGEILAFLDPDDSLVPGALTIMHDAHEANPGYSIIHSTHYVCDAQLNVVRIAEYPKALPPNTPFLLLGDGSVHHFASFKKECYSRTPGLKLTGTENKAVDMELYYLLEEQGNILFIDLPLYNYRIHSGGISTSGNEWKATMIHYRIIETACLRRIRLLKDHSSLSDARYWIKRYRTRYYKVRILNSFRRKQWLRFGVSLAIFPFVGGMDNLISYFSKLPKGGMGLIRRSLMEDYKILE